MPIVTFYRFKDTTTTERISITVQKTSTSSGIFKTVSIVYGQQLRLTSSHFLMDIHKLYQGCQPMVRHFYIRIQQQIIFGINLCQCLVIAFGKTPVLFQQDSLALRKLALQQIHRLIRRGIVSHIHYSLVTRVIQNGGQILGQHLSSVPVQYDNCYLIHSST